MRKNIYKVAAIVMAFAVIVTSVVYAVEKTEWMKPAAARSLYQQAIDDHGFIYGLNYAWAAGQGCSLSDNQARNLKCTFNEKSVRTGFYNISKMGIDCTTFWLFMAAEGIVFDDAGDVTGIQDKFLTNLETCLKIAREYGVALNLCIQPHIDFMLSSGSYTNASKEIYDKYTRMLTDPTVRGHYVEKCVRPALKLINKYRDIVFSIEPYCEPQGDIYGSPNGYMSVGTTIEKITEFIKILTDVTREEVPDVPVWVTGGWNYQESMQYLNRIDLDFIGFDTYSDNAELPDISKYGYTVPVLLGEFGPLSMNKNNTLFHLENYKRFIENAKDGGYTGAMYWCYDAKGYMRSILAESDTSYMPQLSNIYYTIKDDTNAFKGIESGLDNPVMLAHAVDGTLSFIASRDAYEYEIERSVDGKNFAKIATIAADEADSTGALIGNYKDETGTVGKSYYYRVTAVDFDGNRAVSDVSLPMKMARVVCDEKDNLVKDYSFEGISRKDDIKFVADKNNVWDVVLDGTEGVETHTGKKAIRLSGVDGGSTWAYAQIDVDVQENTNYTYTFFAKCDEGKLIFKLLDDDWSVMYESKTSNLQNDIGKWKRYTYSFNSGDNTKISLLFADNGGKVTVDDLYLFKTDD